MPVSVLLFRSSARCDSILIDHRQHLPLGVGIDVRQLIVVIVNKVELIQLITAKTHNQQREHQKDQQAR